MNDYGMVFMTAADRQEAEKIAGSLVEKKLAACVQIVSDIRSFYWWEGRVHDDPEVLFTAKTTAALFPDLAAEVRRLHSYDVPEIVFIPIHTGTADYLQWISDVTASDPKSLTK